MQAIGSATPAQTNRMVEQQTGLGRVLWVALVALALWLLLEALSERGQARLPLAPEGMRALREMGISGALVRRLLNGMASLFALSYAGAGLLLVSRGSVKEARGSGLALLILGGALLGAGRALPLFPALLLMLATATLMAQLAGGRLGVRRTLALGVAGQLLVSVTVLAAPLLRAPGGEALAAGFVSPLMLLVWLPLPFVLAHATARAGWWQRPRVDAPGMRRLALGVLAGVGAGLLAGGIGSRLAMRGVALAAGIPPTFTIEGTLGLLLMGGLFGLPLGALYALLRGALAERWRGLTYGVLLLCFILLPLLLADTEGEIALAPLPIGIALFSVLPLGYGLLLERFFQALEHRLPRPPYARGAIGAGYALLSLAGALSFGLLLLLLGIV